MRCIANVFKKKKKEELNISRSQWNIMEFSFLYPFWWVLYWIAEIWSDYMAIELKFMRTSIRLIGKEELESFFFSPTIPILMIFLNLLSEGWHNQTMVTIFQPQTNHAEVWKCRKLSRKEKKKKKEIKRLNLISFMTKYIHIKGGKTIPFQMSVSKKSIQPPTPTIKATPN